MTTTADDIEATILAMADDAQAKTLVRFFKTGPGEYGEGDKFAGVTNPQVRLVVKEAWKTTPLSEAIKLVKNEVHEVRLCGLLIMVEQYLKAQKKKDCETMQTIVDAYLSLHPFINNWDLVDLSAIKIIGNYEVQNPEWKLMDEWIKPGHTLWQQRIAMVATWKLTRDGRSDVCFRRAEVLLANRESLLHKAAGWMLRETWKKGYREELRDFLSKHVKGMPAVMLSYACEQMTDTERKEWQAKRKGK
ncbi:MAG: DNA alkylation repair protein [Bacteroidales bacterium]|nr:DNA alkylation repair protein [Bacteroidales bacterium]